MTRLTIRKNSVRNVSYLMMACVSVLALGVDTKSRASENDKRLALIGPKPAVQSNDTAIETDATKHITLVLVGDTGFAPHRAKPNPKGVTKHGRWLTFDQTTQKIASEINGDINFANIETVITDNRLPVLPKAYNFATHSNGARHLVKTGFNLFSLANNHSFDHGTTGLRDTLRHSNALMKNGLLAYAGIGKNLRQAASTPVFTVKNTDFAFGAIGIGAGGGGIQWATHKRLGQLSLYRKSDLALLATNLSTADADFRLLSIHRGAERVIRPSRNEISAVRKLVKQSAADIMIGHHAHVTRGIEMMGDKLIVYGLGNFLHHGTANMAGKNGCLDYSIIVRVHLVQKAQTKPQIAAIEVLPITQTHMQTRRLPPATAAKRIAVLNGLAQQFDNSRTASRGLRFGIRPDGSGLYCAPVSAHHAQTRTLCRNAEPRHARFAKTYARAVRQCGGINPAPLLASMKRPTASGVAVTALPQKPKQPAIPTARRTVIAKKQTAALSITPTQLRGSLEASAPETNERVTKPERLEQNPAAWPKGMPLAWRVPRNETYAQKRARWLKKRYSIAEVEKLLIKRGLLPSSKARASR